MKRTSLYFTAPRQITIQEEDLAQIAPGEVLVETMLSAISPGTETLIYRGQFPNDLPVDETIASLSGKFGYPLKYGYSAVGQVVRTGEEVDRAWKSRLVFAFHPHESHFLATPDDLFPLPPGISAEEAVFLPNMETAVNFLMDGAPLIGDKVIVFGQGIVGLLTTALLARFPLGGLFTLDRYPQRRQASLEAGAHASFDPSSSDDLEQLKTQLSQGADLVYELSGSPAALDQAITLTGFSGRIVIGSWYGKKQVHLDLGGRFHRSRMRLISSQVSSLAPELSGRWTKERRFEVAWEMIRKVKTSRYVTHRFSISDAAQAYQLLDLKPEEMIQAVLTY